MFKGGKEVEEVEGVEDGKDVGLGVGGTDAGSVRHEAIDIQKFKGCKEGKEVEGVEDGEDVELGVRGTDAGSVRHEAIDIQKFKGEQRS